MTATALAAPDPRDWIPKPPPEEPEAARSQADEALRRVIAAQPAKSPKLPVEPAARRRTIQLWGW